MIRVQTNNLHDAFMGFICSWFDLLAQGDADQACAAIDKPNIYGVRWTPEMIFDVLEDNFGPGTVFASQHPEGPTISSVSQTKGDARVNVVPFSDGSGFSVEYDVPLNGEWSGLTAQFEFLGKHPQFAVVLHDLHVL